MSRFFRFHTFLFLLLISSVAAAQKTEAPKTEAPPSDAKKLEAPASKAPPSEAPASMMTYQMVLFKAGAGRPPHAANGQPVGLGELMQGHLANLARLNNERVNLIYGPFTDTDPNDVFDAATARQHFAGDPFVKSGMMVLEVKSWLGPRGWFHPPASPAADDPAKLVMEPLIFCVLVRGPAAKADPPVHPLEQRQEFQKGHRAYMGELHKQGKLVMAGPFMPGPSSDDGDWRGVVVYRVGTIAEAQALAANDPAVKAGRLAIEARSWMTLRGILK